MGVHTYLDVRRKVGKGPFPSRNSLSPWPCALLYRPYRNNIMYVKVLLILPTRVDSMHLISNLCNFYTVINCWL